jgi:hypothetical protein
MVSRKNNFSYLAHFGACFSSNCLAMEIDPVIAIHGAATEVVERARNADTVATAIELKCVPWSNKCRIDGPDPDVSLIVSAF